MLSASHHNWRVSHVSVSYLYVTESAATMAVVYGVKMGARTEDVTHLIWSKTPFSSVIQVVVHNLRFHHNAVCFGWHRSTSLTTIIYSLEFSIWYNDIQRASIHLPMYCGLYIKSHSLVYGTAFIASGFSASAQWKRCAKSWCGTWNGKLG